VAFLLLQGTLAYMARVPGARRLWGDEIMYRDLAARWARGEAPEVDPLWPPLYVWLLGLFEGLGLGVPLFLAFQVLLLIVAATALRALGEQWTGSRAAGMLAAALLLLDPQVAAFGQYFWPEALHLALFLSLLWLLSAHGRSWPALLLAGLLLGLALLTKSLLLPFVPLFLFPVVAGGEPGRGLLRCALVLAVAGAVVAPVVCSNGARHGVYVVADSSRFNLWVGLNDRSRRNLVDEIVSDEYQRYRATGATLRARNKRLSEQLAALVHERGPARLLWGQLGKQYFRLFDKDSFFTDQLPGGAIAAQGSGYVGPPPGLASGLRSWSYALYGLVLCAGAVGFVRADLRGRPWLRVALLFVAGNLLLFLGLHVNTRYRLPLMPLFDLFAAALLVAPGSAVPGARRLAAGVLLAALLLFLAFGRPFLP
jgi:hypothetical protein